MPKIKKAEVTLSYSNYIDRPPVQEGELYQEATSRDKVTVEKWRKTWLENIKANKEKFGSFKDFSVGKLFGTHRGKPVICAGSGPSLKRNGHELKDRKEIPLVSCLHNYHFFEDQGIKPELYVSLDAGEITLEEVSEGGKKTPEEYWETTKDKTLACYIGTSPRLLEKWQGEVLFFNAPLPDKELTEEVEKLEKFNVLISSGGNVLGACVYIAKAIYGGNPIAFVGADFAFGYDNKFHGWDSKYDLHQGHVIRSIDVFGNKVHTWPSYHGFKCFFDHICMVVPGFWINCTEGGTLGAYREGNLQAIRQMDLCDLYEMYHISDNIKESCENPEIDSKIVLY